jgi:amino acid adenylation domain-containing protein/FkbM family methyltransferase
MIGDTQDAVGAKQALLRQRVAAAQKRQHTARLAVLPEAAIGVVSREQALPMSFSQERLWFLEQLESTGAAYHMPVLLRLRGELDVAALRQAFGDLIARHESLRTRFISREGVGLQQVDAPWTLSLPVRELAQEEREGFLRACVTKPFDLQQEYLLRVELLQCAADEHLLLIVQHHLITDGWSVGILLQEMSIAYRARCRGQAAQFAPLAIQYGDWAVWQRRTLDAARVEVALKWWREQLKDAPVALELPTDAPRPAVQSYRGACHRFEIPASLSAALRGLAQSEGATLFMVLLSAWQIVLSRWSGQEDLVVGTPIAGRTHSQVEGLLGFFVNTLALRGDLRGLRDYRSFLRRVRETTLGAYAHQDLPFERLVEALCPVRDLSRQALFQVMFVLQNTGAMPTEKTEAQGSLPLHLELLELPQRQAKFDMTLSVAEHPQGLSAGLEYASDLFEPASIERMCGHFHNVLAAIAADPDQALHRINLLSGEEREQVLLRFNDTAAEYPADKCIHELIEMQVERTPEAIALIVDDCRLSYAELNRRANQLARHLQAHGVGAEARVAICVERSVEMVVGLLGILKAGGAYVPLEPSQPAEQLVHMLGDCTPHVILTQQRFAGLLAGLEVPVLMLDTDHCRLEMAVLAADDVRPIEGSHTGDAAYVIYTSGSTGWPKGVINQHDGVVNRLWWALKEYGLEAHDRVLQKTPYGFDVSVWEFFLPLLAGAQLVLARPGGHQDPRYLAELIERTGITTIHFVPSMLQAFVNEVPGHRCANLRRVLCSGEALPYCLQLQFQAQFPQCELHNLYGPTEAAIDVSAWQCVPDRHAGIVPIGRPISNIQIYVLDRHRQPVPIGVRGEIYLGGIGVARGYLNRPELTAERFVSDPYRRAAQPKMYKTGDVGRWLSDGNIEYLGREDFQVKIRGHRIELGGIESRLAACETVQEALVVAHEPQPGDKRLVAYLVPAASRASPVLKMLQLQKTHAELRGRTVDLPNGMSIFHQNSGETDFLYAEIFEQQGYLKHGVTLRDGDCVFDVGANIGLFSLFVAQRCRDATLYAFEPIPPVFDSLRLNAELYGLKGKLFECGLSNRPRQETFTFYPRNTVISSSATSSADARQLVKSFLANQQEHSQFMPDERAIEELLDARLQSEQYPCELRTISAIIAEHAIPFIHLLKIDVENAEQDVLDGIEEQDWSKIGQVVVEVHDVAGRLAHLSALLQSRGFDVNVEQEDMLQGTEVSTLYAIRQAVPRAALSQERDSPAWVCASEQSLLRGLREQLARELPEYMLPSAYVLLEKLPLTANGKVNRKALPPPDQTSVVTRPFETPQGELEVAIAGIWQDLLHLERVGRHDNFFELGGHSLVALQLMSRLRQQLRLDIPLRQLFAQPTLSGLAQAALTAAPSDLTAIPRADRNQPLPLSWAQQRLWFLNELERAASGAYHIRAGVRLQGSLDRAALRGALDAMVARHEILRTRFCYRDNEPLQEIAAPDAGFGLQEHDFCGLSAEERARSIAVHSQEEAIKPFELAHGPLIRGRLLRTAPDEHILLITQHHIISDGWSSGILLRELAALYTAFSRGQSDPLPPLPIQYADYALWQRSWLQGAALKKQVAFWKTQLTGAPPLLELHTDRPRQAEQTFAGDAVPLQLDALLVQELKALSLRHGLTLYMTVMAAWAAVLSRLSGQVDIVIGTPVANRTRTDIEGLIGFFVNTLALRISVSGSAIELLQRVKACALDAQSHQDLPFEQVVDIVRPPRSLSYTPIFQAVLSWRNQSDETFELPGLHATPLSVASRTVKFDLILNLTESPGGLAGELEYATALFDRSTIERQVGYLKRMLVAMVADEGQSIDGVALLPACEREQVLRGFNRTHADYPAEKCIHELIETQVERTPDATALIVEDIQLTFGELNRRANQLARHLQAHGVSPEARVAICVERSVEMVVGLLGILKSGGAYVPLEPNQPAEQLEHMLRDSTPRVILTQQRFAGLFAAVEVPVLLLDSADCRQAMAALEAGNVHPIDGSHLRDAAYVIYTSGSTGWPKGVVNQHDGVVNRLWWALNEYALAPRDRVLQKTPYGFDVSVWEFFLPLLAGAQLIVARPGGHQDPHYLADLIERTGITTIHFVPSMLQAFVSEVRRGRCGSLRRVLCSGEALPYSLQQQFRSLFPHCELHNLYGPTEAAIDVTAYRCVPDQHAGIVPIGRPISNIQIYVLDRHRQPVPIGVRGEIYIGGIGVARGYLNRPELTAERFVADPWSEGLHARLYRTGDVGRWLADGNVEYLGREDFQVKIRGHRIELGGIESRLAACEGVQEALVVAHEAEPGDKRLVAYLAPSASRALPVLNMLQLHKTQAGLAERTIDLPNGMTVFHQNSGETGFLYNEIFEQQGYLKHGVTLGDGDCVVDVGANIGLFSLFVAQRCRDATLYAFEPIPPVFDSLRLNAALYGLKGKVFECGLSDRSRRETFTFYPHNTVISSSLTSSNDARGLVKSFLANQRGCSEISPDEGAIEELLDARLQSRQYVCDLRTLSEIIAEHAILFIHLLKIDVENAEQEVVEGIAPQDWSKIGQVVVEVHDVAGRLARLSALLHSHGFEVNVEQEDLLQGTQVYTLYAKRLGMGRGALETVSAPPAWTWASEQCLLRDLRAQLSRQLPEYMLPSAYVLLEKLPLTTNGKVNRKALPSPDQFSVVSRPYETPMGEIEIAIAGIWQALLGVDRVGRHDNFFELGGHSLLVVRASALLAERLGRKLALFEFFSRPSVAALAAAFDTAMNGPATEFFIRLRESAGTDHAVLFMPTILGSGSAFARLAQRIGLSADMLTCRLPGTEEGETPLASIAEMAAFCREQLVDTERHRSWSLVGWSFGGVIAYELARQMSAMGLAVRCLALVDSYLPPAAAQAGQASAAQLECELKREFGASIGAYVDTQRMTELFKVNNAAFHRYSAPGYAGKTVELRARASEPLLRAGGGAALRPLPAAHSDVQWLLTEHYSMLSEENLPRLAEAIKRSLSGTSA